MDCLRPRERSFCPKIFLHSLVLSQKYLHFVLLKCVLLLFYPPLFVLFCLRLYVPVNSYGHVKTVSSPNHTFFLGKLDLVVKQYFVHILSLVTLVESAEGEIISWSISTKYGTGPGSNSGSLDLQSESLPTALRGPSHWRSSHLRVEMQIFSLHWMMQNIRLFNVCEARRASRRH